MPRGKVKVIESFPEADRRIVNIETTQRTMNDRLAAIDPPAIDASVKAMHEEAARVHQTMGVMILKLSVVTELPRYLNKHGVTANLFLPKMLSLFDMPDEWWRKRGNMNLEGWAVLIAQFDAARPT